MTADLGLLAAGAYPSPPSYPSPQRRKPSVPSLYDRTAMSSLSPNQPSQHSFGGGPSVPDKNSLSTLNLDFLRTMNEKRTTRDGQPQKRRGPKPDSKPALTRRQELNRQAQRTHRERKELYIKALEDEVLRLKEIFSNISQDKQRLAEENRQLKALLAQNGLGVGSLTGSSVLDDSMSNPSASYSPSASMAGSYVPASSNTSAFTPPPLSAGSGGRGGGGISPHSATYPLNHHRQLSGQGNMSAGGAGSPANQYPSFDYDQAGIDFVLALEKPCMNHLPWMLERGTAPGTSTEPCGHALMASCPPEPFSDLSPDIPFGQQYNQPLHQHSHSHSHSHAHPANTGNASGNSNGNGTWQLSKSDLSTLLDLSKRLNLEGEITPVMAWGMVLAHPRLGEMRAEDFGRLTEELGGKVRCYGFGAVMEEFEVRDALESVFSMKPDYGGY